MWVRWLFPDPTPQISTSNLLLRAPRPSDFSQWRDVRHASHAFLKPFEPRWSKADLNKRLYDTRIRRSLWKARRGDEFTFFIFTQSGSTEQLVGGISLTNIRQKISRHANMGYWMSEQAAGSGIMTKAVSGVLPFVFDRLGLQRLHAACLPHNIASRRVLEKNGFKEEGFADRYLYIDGAWRDHALYGLSKERYKRPEN